MDIVLEISKGGREILRTRGEGVQKPENFADVLNRSPIPVLRLLYHPQPIAHPNDMAAISAHVRLIIRGNLVGGEKLLMVPVRSVVSSNFDDHFPAAIPLLKSSRWISGIK